LTDFGNARQREDALAHLVSRKPEEAWTSGQWMTERQGGSDVGRNSVVAKREGDHWRLYGQKFFCSNIGCEMALVLARPEGATSGTRGLALFLVPRDTTEGHRNAYRIDRLKDKLGTRAMATGEVTLEGAYAELVGDVDHGFAQITAMLNITRLHNAVTAAAIMRRGWMLASAYAAEREAFGRTLDKQPLHQEVLGELKVQADRALYLTMRMAQLLGCIENGQASEEDQALFRLGIALTKLYTGKQAVAAASEAIECFGGQGYMEDTGLPRLLRDAQVLPIWEGATNVLSLDALRVMHKSGTLDALSDELERNEATDREGLLETARKLVADESDGAQRGARRLALAIAESWSAGLVSRYASSNQDGPVPHLVNEPVDETVDFRHFCSFCRKNYLERESRVAGGPGGSICESCLGLCEEVLQDLKAKGWPVFQLRTFCAFCGRRYAEVDGKMVGGPGVSICEDDIVELRKLWAPARPGA
jgi:alkylation response protein AidB-like acyl-CoA dehydrogenase